MGKFGKSLVVASTAVVLLTGCSVSLGGPEYEVVAETTTPVAAPEESKEECSSTNSCQEEQKDNDGTAAEPEATAPDTSESSDPVRFDEAESTANSPSEPREEPTQSDSATSNADVAEEETPWCVKAPRPTYHATFPEGKITMSAPTAVQPGTTLKVGIELQEASGSRLAPADSQRLRLTISGPGITVNALPDRFSAGGLAEFAHILGSNDSGIVLVRAELIEDSTGSRLAVIQRYVHVGYGVHSVRSENQIYVSAWIQNEDRLELHCNGRRMIWSSSGSWRDSFLSELWTSPEPGLVEVVYKGSVIESIPFG